MIREIRCAIQNLIAPISHRINIGQHITSDAPIARNGLTSLHRVRTQDQGFIVVDRETRRLRHEAPPSDHIGFLMWRAADGPHALGFAEDLQSITLYEGAEAKIFAPLSVVQSDNHPTVRPLHTASNGIAQADGAIEFDRTWPTLWKTSALTPEDASDDVRIVARILRDLCLDGGSGDLIRLSRIDACPELGLITQSILPFYADKDFSGAIPEIASGPGYPAMFEVLRAHFSKVATRMRLFAPIVDWGGSPECVSAGAHTYGCPRILPYGHAKVTFGRYCSIAEAVHIILGNHAMDGSSTYPFKDESPRWPSQISQATPDWVARDVVVGNDVWIGFLSTILSGARIGDGAIIGAGSVVRGSIPPYTIAVGNPAKVVRERYPPDIVARFLKLRWWDWPDWKVDRHSVRMFSASPAEFLDAAEADLS